MPIDVTCPGCHKRFKVSEKFAGQKGPCPQCKTVMQIPKLEDQVVIHAPADSGPKDSKGRSILKTAKTKDSKFNPVMAGSIAGVSLLVLVAAFLLRGQQDQSWFVYLLGMGALLVGPLVAWAGYPLMRDQELEAFSGGELWLRCTICGAAFAAAWGVYSYVGYYLGGGDWPIVQLSLIQMLFASGFAVAVAGIASFASLDLQPTNAGIHCLIYFSVTIVLRLAIGLAALPGLSS